MKKSILLLAFVVSCHITSYAATPSNKNKKYPETFCGIRLTGFQFFSLLDSVMREKAKFPVAEICDVDGKNVSLYNFKKGVFVYFPDTKEFMGHYLNINFLSRREKSFFERKSTGYKSTRKEWRSIIDEIFGNLRKKEK